MEEKMTVEDALVYTVKLLNNIRVPVQYATEIGVQIEGCIKNIQLCIDALAEQRNKMETKEETEEQEDE